MADSSPTRENPDNELVWRQLFLTNQLTMALYAAWACEESEIEKMFGAALSQFQDRPSRYREEVRRLTRRYNDVEVYMTMAALFRKAYADEDERHLSLSELAGEVPEPAPDKKKLREQILPLLSDLGYIEEFDVRPEGSTQEHKIALTHKGIEAHRAFLQRCQRAIRQIEEEKTATRHRLLRD